MGWKIFKLFPWVYYCRGVNGTTLYDWLNEEMLCLNNEQGGVLEKLMSGVPVEVTTTQKELTDKLKKFGFFLLDDVYIDNIMLGSKLQKAMQFINTFQVQRLDLVLGTRCERYASCPLRGSKVVSHACESCLGCSEKQLNIGIGFEGIMKLLLIYRPQIVTLSGGELFSDASLTENILSALLTLEYVQMIVLIMPSHAVIKFKNKLAEYLNMFTEAGRSLVLTVVLTDDELGNIPRIMEIKKEIGAQMTFIVYVNLDSDNIPALKDFQKALTIVPAFYSRNESNILGNLKKFLDTHPVNPYTNKSVSIESLTNAVEYNYAQCVYGNLLIKLPEGEFSVCKGYYLLNLRQERLNRKALQKITFLWDDPCKDCSLKGACTMCRSIIKLVYISPDSCPVWRKSLEGEE